MLSFIEDKSTLMTDNRNSSLLGIICLLITVTLLVAGLWPFNFIPINKVEWVRNGRGIRFYGQGTVFSQEPLVIQNAASRNTSVTVELWIRPDKDITNMVPSILTLYGDNQSKQFMIGQWKNELIIRIPAIKVVSRKHYREISIGNALIKERTNLITVTSSKEATDVYVNGKLEERFPHYALIPDDTGFSGYLILGNSAEGKQSWSGTFLGIAIYDQTLDGKEALTSYHVWQRQGQPFLSGEKKPVALYLFDEHDGEQIRDHSGFRNSLLLPSSFRPFHRTILQMPEKDSFFSRWNTEDITVNILGFVPFGFFLSAWLLKVKHLTAPRVYGLTFLIGSCLSLAIELIQAYLPTRDSSLTDVISNTMGTAAGILLLKYALPILHKIKGNRMFSS